MDTGVGERTPLHPRAVHQHTSDELVKLYDGDYWDGNGGFNYGKLKTYTGHICWCGVMFLLEPD
jgi:hypothetical protein